MKASDYVNIAKEIYKFSFEIKQEKEIAFLKNYINTAITIYYSNNEDCIRNYLIREIYIANLSYEIKRSFLIEIYNCDLSRLKIEVLAMINALYNCILRLKNVQANTSLLDVAELILKLNDC